MTRLFRALMVVLLLGSQAGMVFPAQEVCQETSDCCTPQGVCDVNCVTCACCTSRPTNFSSSLTIDPANILSVAAPAAGSSVALPLLSTDILHVPKSI